MTTQPVSLARATGLFFVGLILPVFFFQGWKSGVYAPTARTGDEPHYLVQAFSLVRDGDLLVANNYAGGGVAQGRFLGGRKLDHHSNFVHRQTGRVLRWDLVYRVVPAARARGGTRFELRPEHSGFSPGDYREVGLHPPGYSLLVGLVAFPLIRFNVRWFEVWLVLLQMLLLAYALARLGRAFAAPRLFVAAAAVSLSFWYFAATFFTESITPAFVLLSLAAFRERRTLALSFWLGALFFIKESHALVAPLFWIAWVARDHQPGEAPSSLGLRALRDAARLALFSLVAMLLFLVRSMWLYGRAFQTYRAFEINADIPAALWSVLIGSRAELLGFEPAVIVFLAGLVWTIMAARVSLADRTDAIVAGLALAVFLQQYLLVSLWVDPTGGSSYGARLLVPFTAALLPGFFFWRARLQATHVWLRLPVATVGVVLIAASMLNGFWAVTHLKNAPFVRPCVNLMAVERRHCWR